MEIYFIENKFLNYLTLFLHILVCKYLLGNYFLYKDQYINSHNAFKKISLI